MQVCDLLLLSIILVVVSFRSGCRRVVCLSCGVFGAVGFSGGGGDNCDRHGNSYFVGMPSSLLSTQVLCLLPMFLK